MVCEYHDRSFTTWNDRFERYASNDTSGILYEIDAATLFDIAKNNSYENLLFGWAKFKPFIQKATKCLPQPKREPDRIVGGDEFLDNLGIDVLERKLSSFVIVINKSIKTSVNIFDLLSCIKRRASLKALDASLLIRTALFKYYV